jgi:hypothetical protein
MKRRKMKRRTVKNNLKVSKWKKSEINPDPNANEIIKTFGLTRAQVEKIELFRMAENLKWAKKHKTSQPYFGAIGGSMAYIFIPNSIGLDCQVKHASGKTLDVSEYHLW